MPQDVFVSGSSNNRSQASRFFGQYVIKNKFQFKFSLILFGVLALSTFVMWFEGNVTLNRLVSSGLIPNDEVVTQLRLVNSIVGKTGILILALAFGFFLFLSHFVAGPIYRFEKTFEAIRDGNLTMLMRLRKRDEFQETADLFNQALASLRNKLSKDKQIVSDAIILSQRLAETLRQAGRTDEANQMAELSDRLKGCFSQIRM